MSGGEGRAEDEASVKCGEGAFPRGETPLARCDSGLATRCGRAMLPATFVATSTSGERAWQPERGIVRWQMQAFRAFSYECTPVVAHCSQRNHRMPPHTRRWAGLPYLRDIAFADQRTVGEHGLYLS